MNFLALCRAVARESGTLAGGGFSLSTVTNPTNARIQKIVGWVGTAWENIQIERKDWLWMRRDFAHAIVPGIGKYSGAMLDIARLGAWSQDRVGDAGCYYQPFTLYDPATGKADEGALLQIGYDEWRERYLRGVHDATRPTEYALSPARELCLGAYPDKAYMLAGEYRVSPQVLVVDTDVPEMPEEYHGAIVWEALRLMANADEAPTSIATASGEYAAARGRMVRDQLPEVTLG